MRRVKCFFMLSLASVMILLDSIDHITVRYSFYSGRIFKTISKLSNRASDCSLLFVGHNILLYFINLNLRSLLW